MSTTLPRYSMVGGTRFRRMESRPDGEYVKVADLEAQESALRAAAGAVLRARDSGALLEAMRQLDSAYRGQLTPTAAATARAPYGREACGHYHRLGDQCPAELAS